MASQHLRRRGAICGFRRRVPDMLAGRVGRSEINRSLRTHCPREAARRARHPALQAAQAKLLLDQLLAEPLLRSPTADELADAMARGDWTYAKMLFNRGTPALVMALPPEDRAKAAAHLSRIADRAEVGVARARSDWERLRAEAALLQAAEAEERANAAEKRVVEAKAKLRKTKVATEISARLAEMAASLPRLPVIPALEPDTAKEPNTRKAKPLRSKLVAGFITEKTRVSPSLRCPRCSCA